MAVDLSGPVVRLLYKSILIEKDPNSLKVVIYGHFYNKILMKLHF